MKNHPASSPSTENGSRLSAIAINITIAFVATVVSYLIVEAVFFRMLFPGLMPSVRPQMHETPGVLTQTTKASYAPRNYVAILGDSIAEGLGDTLLEAGNNVARAFHAAHVVHRLTGRDVVTFGRGGAGNAESLVRQTAHIMAGSHCYFFPTLDEPSQIFAYFYEGNDIQDNLGFLARVAQKYGRSDEATIDKFLIDEYATFPHWRCHTYFFDIAGRMVRLFYKYYYLKIRNTAEQQPGANILQIAGQAVNGPSGMEGPALNIDDAGTANGVKVFERALRWLRLQFPNTPITVVYVPSALSVYQLDGSVYIYSIEPREEGRTGRASPAQISRRSDLICNLVRTTSVHHNVGFFDTRPGFRQAASLRVLHGPLDWVHPNRDGYQVLGELLVSRMDDWRRVDSCNHPTAGN